MHPKNYKIQYNLKILKRKFTHYNIAKTSIKEVKISSWPRRKPNQTYYIQDIPDNKKLSLLTPFLL